MLSLTNSDVFRAIVDRIDIGVYAVDLSGKIVYWNHGAEEITGFLGPQVLGRGCGESILSENDERRPLLAAQEYQTKAGTTGGAPSEQMKYLRHRSGQVVAVRQWTMAIRNEEGHIAGAVSVFSEQPVAESRREKEPEQARDVDPETGAVSRAGTEAFLGAQMEAVNQQQKICGLIAIRLEKMKEFRATHGSEAANTMLRVVGHTLKDMARRSDLVGRWDGDCFLAVLPGCGIEPLERVAARMRRVAERVGIPWWGNRLSASTSVWLTMVEKGDTVGGIETRLKLPESALRDQASAEAGD